MEPSPEAFVSQAPRPYYQDIIEPEDVFLPDSDPGSDSENNLTIPLPPIVPVPEPTELIPEPPLPPNTVLLPEVVVIKDEEPKKPIEDPEKEPEKPQAEDEWEDAKALKPPSDDLPSFVFDDFESDEETVIDRLQRRSLNVNNYKADPEKEKQFYKSLVLAYEAFLSETGKIPTCMPVATPNFPIEPYHLKAIARIIKDPRLGKGIETFSATAWPNLKQLGLKWILNALHHNPSVRTLRIARGDFELDDDNRLIRFIQSSPHVTSIKLPNLTACGNTGDLILRALLREMASNSTILNLNLEAVTYSEVTFGMLLTMLSTNTTLQKLNLRFTDFSYHNRAQRFMQALIDNPDTALRRINFPLMRGAVLWTAQMLEYNRSLTNIDLSHIALGSHAALLKRALEMNTQLQILNVSSTHLTDTDLAHLLEPLWTNSTLTHLDLSSNSMLSNDSARNIGDMLMQNTGIQTLILDSLHGIGKDKLAKRLAQALRVNSSVHHLSIQSSSTDSTGIAALSEALVINHGLHELKLSNNPINDDSIATLVKGLKPNFGVHSLWIEQCKFGDSAVKALVPWLKTTNVLTKRLNLGSNRISEASYSFLREAIHSNPALKNLILGSVSVQKSLMERLAALRSDVSALFQSS